MQKKLGLVLAGGGGKGAYQIGVWKYLKEIGIDKHISVISGTSVGGVNAALLAMNDYDIAEDIWRNHIDGAILSPHSDGIDFRNLSRYMTLHSVLNSSYTKDGIFSREGLIDIMNTYIDFETIKKSNKSIYATCIYFPDFEDKVDIVNGPEKNERVAFRLNNYDKEIIKTILLATSAIPFVFPPEYINGRKYIDGGSPVPKVGDNVPLTPLDTEKCTDAIIVNLNIHGDSPSIKDKFGNVIHKEKSQLKLYQLYPSRDINGLLGIENTLNFSPENVAELIMLGYKDSKNNAKMFEKILKEYESTDSFFSKSISKSGLDRLNEKIQDKKEQAEEKLKLSTIKTEIKEKGESKKMNFELDNQNKYYEILSKLIEEGKKVDISTENTEKLQYAVENMKLLIPVVGDFSAGKSSILNSFIGKDCLAVGIDPTTAIPAELYYSDTEYNEGVLSDGSTEKLETLSDIEKYVCLRRYINSPALKKIEPAVLVDMPGFDSPLDSHNQAIFNYLDKGVHYIILIPVTSGTITASIKRQIENIRAFGKECSICLSKTDLRSQEQINAVKGQLINQLKPITKKIETIYCISNNNSTIFEDFVNSFKPEDLVEHVFKPRIIECSFNEKQSVNTILYALKNDKQKNSNAIDKLNDSLEKLNQKKDKLIVNYSNYTFAEEASEIADAAGAAISSQSDSLVDLAMSSGGDAVQSEISNIIQNSVIVKVNGIISRLVNKLSIDFSHDIEDLNSIFSQYNSSVVLTQINESIKNSFDSTTIQVENCNKQKVKQNTTDLLSKIPLSLGLMKVLTPIVSTIFSLVIKLFGLFTSGDSSNRKQRETVRQAIISQIPSIKRDIRTKATEVLSENTSKMIKVISEKYENIISQKKNEIAEVSKALDESKNITERVEMCENVLKNIDSLLEGIL